MPSHSPIFSESSGRYKAFCLSCNYETDDPLEFACPCNSILEIPLEEPFNRDLIESENFTMWRYLRFFPYIRKEDIVSLGEGWTPLVQYRQGILFKLEFLNPTGSFKDRGSSLLISSIHRLVKSRGGYISEDSSGNAGASVAAYSARAGIRADIYVPTTASGPKLDQIEAYGAELVKVSGSREMVTKRAMEEEEGKFYVGHVYHPIFRDGMRTIAYEITEQMGWKAPDYVFLPVSAGTLLLGVIKGFRHLLSSQIIDKMPRIVASQVEKISPVYHKLKEISYKPPHDTKTIADALISTNPPLLDLMVSELKETDGDAEVVSEEEILRAYEELSTSGFYVEPSSAVAYASYQKWLREGKIGHESLTVIILTGSGLKRPYRDLQQHYIRSKRLF